MQNICLFRLCECEIERPIAPLCGHSSHHIPLDSGYNVIKLTKRGFSKSNHMKTFLPQLEQSSRLDSIGVVHIKSKHTLFVSFSVNRFADIVRIVNVQVTMIFTIFGKAKSGSMFSVHCTRVEWTVANRPATAIPRSDSIYSVQRCSYSLRRSSQFAKTHARDADAHPY